MILLKTFLLPLVTLSLLTLLFSTALSAQSNDTFRSWNQPIPSFRIIGNLYYVGASDIASYLITTPEGHILVEGGFAETAPLIEKSIRDLGFKPEDIKILISSHAHIDHAGGLAELKRISGARLVASEADAVLLATGGKGDFHWGDQLQFPAVKADQIAGDGTNIRFGSVELIAHLTPGHTKGNITWTMKISEGDKSYDVVFMGSVSAPGYKLTNNAAYPEIAADFTRTFKVLKSLPCDVFLAPHGFVFSLKQKMLLQGKGPINHFIDPQGYKNAVEQSEQIFEKQIALERSGSKPTN